ncbi:MAG: MFS transporter [Mailhella sp.]|nr:MFS transporter [Mailhella sp.]
MSQVSAGAGTGSVWLVGKKSAFFTLFVFFFLTQIDFVDRQMMVTVFPYLKEQWGLSDTQLGMLPMAIHIATAMLVIPTAWFIDRWSRKNVVVIMCVIWAAGVAGCGMATGYAMLLVCRIICGSGEAAYNPAAQALLSAQFPEKHRSKAIALNQVGASLGAPVGFMAGSIVIDKLGADHVLGILALPAFVFAVLALFIKDYKTVRVETQKEEKGSYLDVIASMLKTPSLIFLYVGAIIMTMIMGAGMSWMPSYFSRIAGMSVIGSTRVAAMLMFSSTCALLILGPILDILYKKHANAGPLVLASGLSCSTVLYVLVYGVLPPGSAIQIGVLLLASLSLGIVTTAGIVSVINLVHPSVRATAISLLVSCQSLLGFSLGPVVAGIISDHFDLGASMLIIHAMTGVAAIGYWICTVTYKRDIAKVAKAEISFEK